MAPHMPAQCSVLDRPSARPFKAMRVIASIAPSIQPATEPRIGTLGRTQQVEREARTLPGRRPSLAKRTFETGEGLGKPAVELGVPPEVRSALRARGAQEALKRAIIVGRRLQ